MSGGLRDRAAVAGVGCTRFTEHWNRSQQDLLVEACQEAAEDAGIELRDIEALWVGIQYGFTGQAGVMATDALRIDEIPATRVETQCASGMDAFRNACIAVAAGVHDVVLACGVEKLSDHGGHGLPDEPDVHPVRPSVSAPGLFAMVATRTFAEYGWDREDLARVSVKNHRNGARHPKSHFQSEITLDEALQAPMISYPLGRYDCSGISDGAAAIVVTSPQTAKALAHRDDRVMLKACSLEVFTAQPMYKPSYDYLTFPATGMAARTAYGEAGIKDPMDAISFAEVHDCFTITELVTYGDLGLCDSREATERLRAGEFDPGGSMPVNVSGGLKSHGHPIGATGCRMIYEATKQLQGRADGVQVPDAELGLCHNLGGPGSLCAITILGR